MAADKELQGTWTATKAERDGKPAADVVGHRLFFSGDRFEIQSKDRKSLYSGTIRVDASAKPTAIDFEHAEGGLKAQGVEGHLCLDGETLTICDNAENLDAARPWEFEAKRVWLCPSHVQSGQAVATGSVAAPYCQGFGLN